MIEWWDWWRLLNAVWSALLFYSIAHQAHERWGGYTLKTKDYTVALLGFTALIAEGQTESVARDNGYQVTVLFISLTLLWCTRAAWSKDRLERKP